MRGEGWLQRIRQQSAEVERSGAEQLRQVQERNERERAERHEFIEASMAAAIAADLALFPEERSAREQEQQRRTEVGAERERLLVRYTVCVVGIVSIILGGVGVLIFGFVWHPHTAIAALGFMLAALGWIPLAERARHYKQDLIWFQ